MKKTTKQSEPQEVILVASANSALASGSLSASVNALNIANGQLGILNADNVNSFTTGSTKATGTLTLTGNAANTQTVTIGTKIYTFQTGLTNVDGNVLIGATASDSIDNLIAAITLAAGAGTTYAAATTQNTEVTASAGAGDTMVVTAKSTGTAGNSIVTVETLANGTFGAATLTGGASLSTNERIKVIQGTPNSNNLSAVSAFDYNDRAYLETPTIDASRVLSVTGGKYEVPQYAAHFMSTFAAPANNVEYLTVTLESRMNDIEYSKHKLDELKVAQVVNSAAASPIRDTLTNLIYKMNMHSVYINGQKNFLVFGIDSTAAAGTTIGTLSAGDAIPFQTVNGVDYSYTADVTFIKTLQAAIADTSALETDTIVKIDPDNVGALDGILVVGFDEPTAAAFDDNYFKKIKATGFTTLTETTNKFVSYPKEPAHSGKFWKYYWEKNVAPFIYNGTTVGHSYDLTSRDLPCYIKDDVLYASTVIDFHGTYDNMVSETYRPLRLTVLTPVAVDNPTDTAADTFTVSTTVSTAVTALNSTLGAWLADAQNKYGKITFAGDSTSSAPFTV